MYYTHGCKHDLHTWCDIYTNTPCIYAIDTDMCVCMCACMYRFTHASVYACMLITCLCLCNDCCALAMRSHVHMSRALSHTQAHAHFFVRTHALSLLGCSCLAHMTSFRPHPDYRGSGAAGRPLEVHVSSQPRQPRSAKRELSAADDVRPRRKRSRPKAEERSTAPDEGRRSSRPKPDRTPKAEKAKARKREQSRARSPRVPAAASKAMPKASLRELKKARGQRNIEEEGPKAKGTKMAKRSASVALEREQRHIWRHVHYDTSHSLVIALRYQSWRPHPGGRVKVSELSQHTGISIPNIMDAIANSYRHEKKGNVPYFNVWTAQHEEDYELSAVAPSKPRPPAKPPPPWRPPPSPSPEPAAEAKDEKDFGGPQGQMKIESPGVDEQEPAAEAEEEEEEEESDDSWEAEAWEEVIEISEPEVVEIKAEDCSDSKWEEPSAWVSHTPWEAEAWGSEAWGSEVASAEPSAMEEGHAWHWEEPSAPGQPPPPTSPPPPPTSPPPPGHGHFTAAAHLSGGNARPGHGSPPDMAVSPLEKARRALRAARAAWQQEMSK